MERKDVLTPQMNPNYAADLPWRVQELYSDFGVRSFYTRYNILYRQVDAFGFKVPRDTNWVLWCENPLMCGSVWREVRDAIVWLREHVDGIIVITVPTNIIIYALVKDIISSYKRTFLFPFMLTIPYAYTTEIVDWNERAAEIVAYSGLLKGWWEIAQLSEKLPIKQVGYPHFLPMRYVVHLQATRRLTVCLSKADSSPRFLSTAFMLHQAVVLYRTQAEYFNTFSILHKDFRFWEVVPICYSLDEMENKCRQLLQDSELCYETAARIHNWWNSLQEWWHWDILFDKWEDEFGSDILLGADVPPFHHMAENWWGVSMIREGFPKGKWSLRPISLAVTNP